MEGNPKYCNNCGIDLTPVTVEPASTGGEITAEHAGFWRRFIAWIIDGIIIGTVFYLLIILFSIGRAGSFPDAIEWITGSFFGTLLNLAIVWLYYSIMESSPTRATLGKMAIGIVVTDRSGNRVSFGRATGRYFAKIISGIILGIGYLMIAFTGKKQGLHDIMADTLVEVKSR